MIHLTAIFISESLTLGSFFASSRLTTIQNADVIWVLTEKGVEETGTHRELIARGGLYAHLYRMYTEQPERKAEEDKKPEE